MFENIVFENNFRNINFENEFAFYSGSLNVTMEHLVHL